MSSLIAYLAILLFLCIFVSLAQDVDEGSSQTAVSGTVSYVIDPFDALNNRTIIEVYKEKGYLNLSLSSNDDALFGSHALRVDYGVQRTESWGGFTSFRLMNPAKRTYNCMGATHLSFWYRVLEPHSLPGHAHLRVVIMDDSDCEINCGDNLNQEVYYSFHHILDDTDSEWREVKIELKGGSNNSLPFWLTGWAGKEGNGVLDLDRIGGYHIEVSIDAAVEMDALGRGAFLMDQLACVGGGELFGAALRGQTSMEEAVAEGSWYYGSDSLRRSNAELHDGNLTWDYTIEQFQSWGAFLSLGHATPMASYYNLSLASKILLDYEVNRPALPTGRATLRFVLSDPEACTMDCHNAFNRPDEEKFFSFHNVLDDPESQNGTVTINLDRKSESSTAELNNFSDVARYTKFDVDKIKGYRFEIDVDSNGALTSQVSGSISFRNLRGLALDKGQEGESHDNLESSTDVSSCIMETGLEFRAIGLQSSSFRAKEFRQADCCEACEEEEDCMYAFSDEFHCWVASELVADEISIGTDRDLKTYWHVKSSSRGDFCTVCDCRVEDRTIDCRGKNLTTMPQTVSIEGGLNASWAPSILDLRDNPGLVFIGSGALGEINDSLEEIHFPANLTYLSPKCLSDIHLLKVVTFQGQVRETYSPSKKQMEIHGRPTNVISSPAEFFGDVCCHQSVRLETELPVGGISFCEVDPVGIPGSDAVYEEFVEYYRPTDLVSKLTPKSEFMSEAAESAEKCAEYCDVIKNCNYFSYDARVKATDHICYLSLDNGTIHEACCSPDDYADLNMTLPGWVSGRVPRARREVDNARVLIHENFLQLSENNQYSSSFDVSLGSTPIRGAVWIEPTTMVTGVQVVITPPHVVLYDNETTVTVKVQVLSDGQIRTEQTFMIANKIQACDSAFTAVSAAVLADETSIHITVESNHGSQDFLRWIAIPLIGVVTIALSLVSYCKRREVGDAVWKVDLDCVKLYDPLTVIGEGTFGLILLGEYKGTQIAVKPVLPRREDVLLDAERELLGTVSQMTNALRLEKQGSTYSEIQDEGDVEQGTILDTGPVNELVDRGIVGGKSHDERNDLLHKKEPVSGTYCCEPLRRRNKYSRLRRDFVREMRNISKLRHPCLTTIMGAVMDRTEVPFIMLEFMEHGSLYDVLHNETMTINGEFILPVLRDIVSGIRFLHATQPQIIHGGLRAQNVLLDLKFRAKVTGFGFSQKDRIGACERPWWTAPEVLRGETEKTMESDVYAFGMTLYEVFSRRDPYDGHSSSSVLPFILDPSVNKRPTIPSGCPPEIRSMIITCLHAMPHCRPTFEKLEMTLRELHHSNANPSGNSRSEWSNNGADKLIFDVFPPHIAEALRDDRKVEPELRDLVTIFFSDIVGFTNISSELPPIKVADMLDRLYTTFDELSDRHEVFKVETIGDAYMAVTNLVTDQPTDHAKRLAEFAADVVTAANRTLVDKDNPEKGCIKIRVGLHSGAVVANVVGSKSHRPRYCLFGDTVNTASRMESSSKENRIHCSEATAHLLATQCPDMPICYRGGIQIKGKGKMHTYWVNEAGGSGLRPEAGSATTWPACFQGPSGDINCDSLEQEETLLGRTPNDGGKRARRRSSLKLSRPKR